MATDHRADVERLAGPLEEALRAHLKTQTRFDAKSENAKLKSVILPHVTKAVQTGAVRVASVLGKGTPSPTTTLAGAWSYKAATQINSTTAGQLATTATPDGVFSARDALMGAVALSIISNAINSGAVNYAKTAPVTKTWTVTDSHPCTACSSVDGETVAGGETFSNGAPHGPIHDGCMCSVTFTPASTARSASRTRPMDYWTDDEYRAKYSSDDLKDMVAKGQAMKNATGDPSYPVADKEDLQKAIHAVGRGGADHDAIRKHIIARAKALGLSDTIPDNWNADGSLSTAKTDDPDGETRDQCKTCKGSGKIREGHVTCPDCKGTGKVPEDVAETTPNSTSGHGMSPRSERAKGYQPEPYKADPDELVQCPKCKKMGDDDASFCDQCGFDLTSTGFVPRAYHQDPDEVVVCPKCEKHDDTDAVFCDQCGTKLEGSSDVTMAAKPETKSRRPRRQRRSLERRPEWRRFNTQFERRVAQDGNSIVLTGMPIRYQSAYDVRDWAGVFRETMHPGVADNAMASRDFDCRFLVNHDGMPLARTASGTLLLEDTPKGLRSEARLDARSNLANDLAVAVERGDITQMSCGFVVATGGDEWRFADDGTEERDIYSFDDLFDVSAVTYPASPTTSIELTQRMLVQAGVESRERIRRLFDLGGSVRAGAALSQHDGEELRAAAEALYRTEKFAPVPELLDAYAHALDGFSKVLRQGKVLSAENQQSLEEALEALHAADEIDIPGITRSLETIDKALDAGQAGLAAVLGRANPDPGPNDLNPSLVSADDPDSDKDARARQRARLDLIRARLVA